MDIPNIDAELASADWPKKSWDLGVKTLDELFDYLAGPGASRESGERQLQDFLLLPVAKAMPLTLIREVEEYAAKQVAKHGDPGDPGYKRLHPNSKARSYFRTIQRGTSGPKTPTSSPSGAAPTPKARKGKMPYGRKLVGPSNATNPVAPKPAKKVTTKKPAAKKVTVAPKAAAPKAQAPKRTAPKAAAPKTQAPPKVVAAKPVISRKPPTPPQVTAARKAAARKAIAPAAKKKVVASGTKTPAKGTKIHRPSMHPATKSDYEWMKSKEIHTPIPPAWTNVMVVDDRNEKHMLARGYDAQGESQRRYHPEHHSGQKVIKYARVAELRKVLPTLDKALDRDAMKLDTAAVTKLIRLTGIRPGSDKDKTKPGSPKAYGATIFEARHITVNANSVKFDFIGKKGVHIQLLNKDPRVVELMRHWKGNKKGNERLFPSPRGRFNDYLESVIPGFQLKDLRTNIGTNAAWAERKKNTAYKNPPTSVTEMKRRKKEISIEVSKVLGNEPSEALKSYIDPEVWEDWEKLFNVDS